MPWRTLAIQYSVQARRDFKALERAIAVRVRAGITKYAETGAGDVKHLQGSADFRLRVGDYRVRFAIVDGHVLVMLVMRIGHRREVYR